MNEVFEFRSETDRNRALDGTGQFADLNEAGVLTAGDIRTAEAICRLGGVPASDRVGLAVALVVRATRQSSVCLDLTEVPAVLPEYPWPDPKDWLAEVAASPLNGLALSVEHDLIYLHRYWGEERQIAEDLLARLDQPPPPVDAQALESALSEYFALPGYEEQRAAAEASAKRWTSVITGGPGTGKTTTLARLLGVLAHTSDRPLRIALAAPTGKAATRMSQALAEVAATEDFPQAGREVVAGLTGSTLHKLLGYKPGHRNRFQHDRTNLLPYDVVVVDETSMVALSMMARLMEALRSDARLILLGDPDQLASVEAGAVLHDIVEGLEERSPSPVSRLRTSHRFVPEIGDLAEAVRLGDGDRMWDLASAAGPAIELIDPADLTRVTEVTIPPAIALHEAAVAGEVSTALAQLRAHQVMCAHRSGPYGVDRVNRQIAAGLQDHLGVDWLPEFHPGLPLIVTRNDYAMDLSNGDTAVVVERDGDLVAVFDDGATGRPIGISRLSDIALARALTIHRSQGSQFGEVVVILPEEDSRLLSRELLYTAITRAKTAVRIVGTESALRAAVERRAARASGLGLRLRG